VFPAAACPVATALTSSGGQLNYTLQGAATYITSTPLCGSARLPPNPQVPSSQVVCQQYLVFVIVFCIALQAYFSFIAPYSGQLQMWSCTTASTVATGGAAYPNGVDTVRTLFSERVPVNGSNNAFAMNVVCSCWL
jgi:hypothetical protein